MSESFEFTKGSVTVRVTLFSKNGETVTEFQDRAAREKLIAFYRTDQLCRQLPSHPARIPLQAY